MHFDIKPHIVLSKQTVTMKVSLPKSISNQAVNKKPLLPLIPDEEDVLTKDNSNSFELRTDPTDNNSPRYKVNQRILSGGENLRTIIKWKREMPNILHGMNAQGYDAQVRVTETTLRGTPLMFFQSSLTKQVAAARQAAIDAAVDEAGRVAAGAQPDSDFTNPNQIIPAMDHVIEKMCPPKALQRVKRYLRRECRKPADLQVRAWFQHLIRINSEEIPNLPPFSTNQELSVDELIDIICFGIPKSWIKEMDRQGFDPVSKSANEVITFCEQIETAEEFDGSTSTKKNLPVKKKKGDKDGNPIKKKLHCNYHGYGSHDTASCRKLQADKNKSNGGGGSYTNKTWSRKSAEATAKNRKELAAFIKKQVAKGVQKELHSMDKNRKADDSDDDSDIELNALDTNTLAAFNYEDFPEDMDVSDSEDLSDEMSV